MRIIVNLDTSLASVAPDRVKAAHQQTQISFEKSGQPVVLEGAAPILGFKASGAYDTAPLLVYHDDFYFDSGVYFAAVDFGSAAIYDYLGIGDGAAENDKDEGELSGEVIWTLAGKRYRSQTFRVLIEPGVIEGDPPEPIGYDNFLKTSQRGAPDGLASLDASGKVPAEQLPEVEEPDLPGGELEGTEIPLAKSAVYHQTISTARTYTFTPGSDTSVIVALTTTDNVQPTWPAGVIWADGVPEHPSPGLGVYQFVSTGGMVLGLYSEGFEL